MKTILEKAELILKSSERLTEDNKVSLRQAINIYKYGVDSSESMAPLNEKMDESCIVWAAQLLNALINIHKQAGFFDTTNQ